MQCPIISRYYHDIEKKYRDIKFLAIPIPTHNNSFYLCQVLPFIRESNDIIQITIQTNGRGDFIGCLIEKLLWHDPTWDANVFWSDGGSKLLLFVKLILLPQSFVGTIKYIAFVLTDLQQFQKSGFKQNHKDVY